jgi:hypothetical protein
MEEVADGAPNTRTADRRIALLLGCASLLFFLPLQHGHFKGSDELGIFEMTRSLAERGDLAVPPIRHTAIGRDGRRYSYFAPGQAVLATPLYALARPLRALLPASVSSALAGPPNQRGPNHYGGELENLLVGLFAPLTTAALVALFFVFQRQLGVSRSTAAILAALLATSTHTTVMASYFLRHSTEALTLLGSLLLFHRYATGGPLWQLAIGAALASGTILIRVPASIALPTLGAYVGWALYVRGDLRAGGRRLALALSAVLLPAGLALLTHASINQLKWGTWLSSPMLEQQGRMNTPLWRGMAGLLLSPGSSVFVYTPLLLLAPPGLIALWRRRRAETLAMVSLAATFLLFYSKFDGWSGLWSAPGPRYLYLIVPLLLLPLGLWLDELESGSRARKAAWSAVAVLAVTGFWVQFVSIFVRWGSVPTLAGYPVLGPDQSDFLFRIASSPVVVMTGLLLDGGPVDSWLVNLWRGWPGFPPRPGAVIGLLVLWCGAVLGCGWLLLRELPELRGAGGSTRTARP